MERKEKERQREKKGRKKISGIEKYNIIDHTCTLKQRGELPIDLMRKIIQESSSVLGRTANIQRRNPMCFA
jgi:hypothetical protein